MSKKTQITILFIIMIIIFITFKYVYKKNNYLNFYEYSLVNTTKDEDIKNTAEKNIMYNSSNIEINNKELTTVSRSSEFNRNQIDTSNYNGNTQVLIDEANENIKTYSKNIDEVLSITNQYREEVEANQLTLDKELCEAASVRALEMAYTDNLSHTRPDGAKCFVVLKDLDINYICVAENIADGFKNSESVCDAWKNSEGHYSNIVCNKYNKIGIGIAQSIQGKYYWVQIFSN